MNRIIGVAGGISSGKTTVSVELAIRLSYVRASFGDYVRKIAKSEGSDTTRETLQAIGKRLIDGGWMEFCTAVITDSGWSPGRGMVIEGIRHTAALENIKKIVSPQKLTFVFISVKQEERAKRHELRGDENLARAEKDSTESEVESLKQYADILLDGEVSPSELISQLLRRLKLS